MGDTSTDKIKEALALLEEAARTKKDEVASLVSNKYDNVKDVFLTREEQARAAIKGARQYASEKAEHYYKTGEDAVKEYSKSIDEEVHRNPWQYIGGVAVGALLLGYIMGRKN